MPERESRALESWTEMVETVSILHSCQLPFDSDLFDLLLCSGGARDNIDFGREEAACCKSSRRSPVAGEFREQTVHSATEAREWIGVHFHVPRLNGGPIWGSCGIGARL
jgi:hypothetical protein